MMRCNRGLPPLEPEHISRDTTQHRSQSGGRGKKDDSATALRKRATSPYGVAAHEITHPTNPADDITTLSRN
ncbi:MAG: hypothetical protein P8Y09_06790 [Deltaproteobacteria bacterium]